MPEDYKTLNLEGLSAFRDRLVREGYPQIAGQLFELYAQLGQKKGRREVDRLKRLADARAAKRIDALEEIPRGAPKGTTAGKYLRLWLQRHPEDRPVPDHRTYHITPARILPSPISHLQGWEFDLVRRMALTPYLWMFVYTDTMWYMGKLRRPGHPLLDGANQIRAYVHLPQAQRVLRRMNREGFTSAPLPLALIRFQEARARYNPETRLINTDGLNPTKED